MEMGHASEKLRYETTALYSYHNWNKCAALRVTGHLLATVDEHCGDKTQRSTNIGFVTSQHLFVPATNLPTSTPDLLTWV